MKFDVTVTMRALKTYSLEVEAADADEALENAERFARAELKPFLAENVKLVEADIIPHTQESTEVPQSGSIAPAEVVSDHPGAVDATKTNGNDALGDALRKAGC